VRPEEVQSFPAGAAGEALSCDRLKAVEDFPSNQIPCSELLLL
jgi:hypothetical protein